MKRVLIFLVLVAALVPSGFANAFGLFPFFPDKSLASGGGDASAYLVGAWFLDDTCGDDCGATTVNLSDTEFIFQNPTNLTLFNEYAFFDSDGNFCGCDRDTFSPNGRIRYTMSAEAKGGQFICTGAAQKTEGTMKTIVFQVDRKGSISIDNALQAGLQIHFFSSSALTGLSIPIAADLKAVPITKSTLQEIKSIHDQCVTFCDANSGLCPDLH